MLGLGHAGTPVPQPQGNGAHTLAEGRPFSLCSTSEADVLGSQCPPSKRAHPASCAMSVCLSGLHSLTACSQLPGGKRVQQGTRCD